jgi:hypothetical protein
MWRSWYRQTTHQRLVLRSSTYNFKAFHALRVIGSFLKWRK